MATHAAWTYNGHHYTNTQSTRLGSPIETYHRDGKRMAYTAWRAAFFADRDADEARKIAAAIDAAKQEG